MVRVNSSLSTSSTSTFMRKGVSRNPVESVLKDCTNFGRSFLPSIFRLMRVALLSSSPSLATTRNESTPLKSLLGVYSNDGPFPVNLPWVGFWVIEKVSLSPSGSDAASFIGSLPSSTKLKLAVCTIGGRLVSRILTVTTPIFPATLASFAL